MLGHEIDEKRVRKNLAALQKTGEPPLVATLDKKVVGLCGVAARRRDPSRPAPLGRITVLVVAEESAQDQRHRPDARRSRRSMDAQERGCELVEVTSNDRRTAAHAFYRHLGYERTSIRFFKKL